eukprot:Blabericola_migrator_1__1484@NODE_1392_length_4634_cov_118_310488_g74_i2_p5_GENE_NODE_1392_length_4634_cov_118_310488_g74_i2NODE_1392_length_4634_cov_118_310488_g74_i2_p5_ORF_typecomplete_len145_score9_65GRIM19/PF06212_12/0_26_NODE_1392_length_4634_cov_118_310488_g74_i233467
MSVHTNLNEHLHNTPNQGGYRNLSWHRVLPQRVSASISCPSRLCETLRWRHSDESTIKVLHFRDGCTLWYLRQLRSARYAAPVAASCMICKRPSIRPLVECWHEALRCNWTSCNASLNVVVRGKSCARSQKSWARCLCQTLTIF